MAINGEKIEESAAKELAVATGIKVVLDYDLIKVNCTVEEITEMRNILAGIRDEVIKEQNKKVPTVKSKKQVKDNIPEELGIKLNISEQNNEKKAENEIQRESSDSK